MSKKYRDVFIFAVILCTITMLVYAQNTPALNQGFAGATMVSGKTSQGQASVTIYDTSYPARVVLGTSKSIDGVGNFAVLVNPALILGHFIVVVDQSGATSRAMVVTPRPSSPSHQ